MINKMLALEDSAVLLGEAIATNAEDGDESEVETLIEQIAPINAKVEGMSQGYGFKICGS